MGKLTVKTSVDIPIRHTNLRTRFISFHGLEKEHFAIIVGDPPPDQVLVRVHSECLTGDVFGSKRCDCGAQLQEALAIMDNAGGGVLIYMRQEGRGIGLYAKFEAYELQSAGLDTYAANRTLGFEEDARSFSDAAEMLTAMQIKSVDLITNNPNKVDSLRRFGISIRNVIPSGVFKTKENERYLRAKAELHRHTLDI